MKHVFTDISEVAHLWANQLQNSARNSGNFFFEGKAIYSYGHHFQIAKHVQNSKGENAVLFTERDYSVTTSGHKRVVSHACNHLNVITCYNTDGEHEQNFNYWKQLAEIQAQKLEKAKKPELYLNEISRIKTRAEIYATFFDIAIPESLQAVFAIENKGQYISYLSSKHALQLAENKRKEAKEKLQHKKELEKWLKGEKSTMFWRNGYDYLRVTGNRVETSQGVKMPISAAIEIYETLKDGKLNEGDMILEGLYNVLAVGKNVKIGCHNFKKSYLLEFGAKLAVAV